MSLTHAILTSLLEKPCTGAELARRFDKSLGHFWQATHQQIYRELGTMERNELIEARGLPTARGQERHFQVLDAGRAALAQWCAEASEPRPIRDELMVRLRACAVLATPETEERVLSELRRHQRLHTEVLAGYELIEGRDFPENKKLAAADALQLAVLRAGIRYEQSWLAWCKESLTDLARFTGHTGPA